MPHSYFVCATPRTGSSLLLGLLESTGVAGHPQAYFRAPGEQRYAEQWQLPPGYDYRDFVRAALAVGRTPNGVFGAKLMWGTLDEVVDRLAAVHPELAGDDPALLNRAFGDVGYVYLRRDDVLAQAVSWLRAEQTGSWVLGGREEISGDGEARYDEAGITHYVETIRAHNAAWEAWFGRWGIEPCRLRYADLDTDAVGATVRVLDHLGVQLPAGAVIAARHRRQADDLNAEWIRRYRSRRSGGDAPAVSPDRIG